jgi:hypothetical protein
MTTLPSLFTDEIYIKGQPLQFEQINNVTNNVTTINAVIAGLFGGQPTTIPPDPLIQIRPPEPQDDINENWNVGNMWVTATTAYVCIDNTELNAKWKISSLEIDDEKYAQDTTFSSFKIVDDMKTMGSSIDYKLSLKANITDVDIALSGKASSNALTTVIGNIYTKTETNNLLNGKADQDTVNHRTASVDYSLNMIQANKADVSTVYNKTDTNNLLNDKANKTETNNLLSAKADQDTVNHRTASVDYSLNMLQANKANISTVYNKTETNNLLNAKASSTELLAAVNNTHTKAYLDNLNNENQQVFNWLSSDKADKYTVGIRNTLVDNTIGDINTTLTSLNNTKADSIDIVNTVSIINTTLTNLTNNKADKTTTYLRTEIDNKLSTKADKSVTYLKSEVDSRISDGINILNNNASFKADKSDTYLRTEIDGKFNSALVANQTSLGNKADKSEVTASFNNLNTDIETLESQVLLNALQEFPDFSIISNDQSLTTTQNGIVVSGSSMLLNYMTIVAPHKAFDKMYVEQGWISSTTFWGPNFSTSIFDDILYVKNGQTNDTYQLYRTLVDGNSVGKQWIQIDCNSSKIFKGFKLRYRTASEASSIKDYRIVGSNDGNSFTSLYSNNNEASSQVVTRPLSYVTPYRYYRIVIDAITNATGANHFCNIQDFTLLESSEYSPIVKLQDRITQVESTPGNTAQVQLDKLVNLLNRWIKNGNLQLSGAVYQSDPIREQW